MQVETLTKRLSLSLSPYQAFAKLTDNGSKENTALLETAEAGTQQHRKSVSMISAAAKLVCKNNTVELLSLNDNGQALMKSFITKELEEHFVIKKSDKRIVFELNDIESEIDEKKKIKQVSVLNVIKELVKQLSMSDPQYDQDTCLIGCFSYDLVDHFEDLPEIEKNEDDYLFYVADQLLIQSLQTQSAQIVIKGFAENAINKIHLGLDLQIIEQKLLTEHNNLKPEVFSHVDYLTNKTYQSIPKDLHVDISDQDFMRQVEIVKQQIIDGNIFQVVLSRKYQIACDDAFSSYGVLRNSNPSPYMYFINFGEQQLFGASPESALKLDQMRNLSLYPIAGTRKRAKNDSNIDFDQDCKVEFELINDTKESAEHMMLVDLARNDIAKICSVGTRKVTKLKQVVKYSHVMHLVSEVQATLKEEFDTFDAYRACANMGTLTGSPKIKASEIIRNHEKKGRGFYGGAICLINANGEFDSAIIIRSALVKNKTASISAGAGIVYDSIAKDEAKETFNKAQAVIQACDIANAMMKSETKSHGVEEAIL